MIENLALYSLFLLLVVSVISIGLKRMLNISYDRKILLLAVLSAVLCMISGALTNVFLLESSDLDFKGKLLLTFCLVFFTYALVQFVFWLMYIFLRRLKLIRMPRFLFDILAFVLVASMILYCIKFIFNQELTGFLITSTVLSAVIGLALQGTMSNIFSGLSLQLEAPFNLDDWVIIGGHEGKIVSQNWRTVTLLTRENHRISITNRFVSEDMIINYSRPTRRQIHNFYITLDYEHPPNLVKKLLREILDEINEVDKDGELGAVVVDYVESGVKYCLRYWIDDYADITHIKDVVLTRLWYKLKRHNIKIPYPINEIKMEMLETPKQNSDGVSDIVNLLSDQEWTGDLDQDKLAKLINECEAKIFAENDVMVKQDDEGDSMFIILEGTARVMVNNGKGKEIEVATKKLGDFFGEMSLLTGEKRSATIISNSDTKVLEIDKESFTQLFLSDEKILHQFIDGMEKCKSGISKAIQEEAMNSIQNKETAKKVFFNKVKGYLLI